MKNNTIYLKLIVITIMTLLVASTVSFAASIAKVTGLTVNIEDEKAYLKWNKVSNVSGYEVYINIPGRGYVYVGDVKNNKVTVIGFSNGDTYSAKIRGFEKENGKKIYGDFSNQVKFKIGEDVENKTISKVKNLKATVNETKVKLTWSQVDDAYGYEVHVNIPGRGYVYIGTVTKTNVTVVGFSAGETYKVKVRAVDSDKNYGEYSSEVTFKTTGSIEIEEEKQEEVVKVSKVTGLKGNVTGDTVKLTWNKVSGADGYEVAIKLPNKSTYTTTKTTGTSKTISGLTDDGTYKIKVRAYKKIDGEYIYGSYSSIINVKIEENVKLNKVTGLKGNVTGDTVKLTWNKVNNADGYEINMIIPGYGNSVMTTTNTTKTITGLTETEYSYDTKVRAYKVVNGKKVYGEYSSTIDVYAEKKETVKLNKVTGVSSKQTSSSAVKLSWNKVTNADGYEISIKIPGYSGEKVFNVTSISKTIAGLENEKDPYKIKVRAYKVVDGNKVYGEYSNTLNIYVK